MKPLQLLRKYGERVGVYLFKCDEKSRFNSKNIEILMIPGFNLVSATAYLFFDATTSKEYTVYFFLCSTLLSICIGFFVTILKSSHLNQIFELLENAVESRKYQL